MHHVFEAYEPWAGELRTRPTGSLVADRTGMVTAYALFNLQERGNMFVGPGTEVYEGMIVGENARADDMDVNPTKEKKLTNVRSSTGDELERLIPPQLHEHGAGAGVLPGRRVPRGHPRRGPDPQGRAVGQRALADPVAGQAGLSTRVPRLARVDHSGASGALRPGDQ